MGAEVNGMPTSHPPTAAPQRRPARLAAPIRAGVTTSFRIRLFTPRIVATMGCTPHGGGTTCRFPGRSSVLYSPECVAGEFLELRLTRVQLRRTSHLRSSAKFALLVFREVSFRGCWTNKQYEDVQETR